MKNEKKRKTQQTIKEFLNPTFENNESKKNICMICPKSVHTFNGGNKYLVYNDIVKQIGPIEPIKIWDEGKI